LLDESDETCELIGVMSDDLSELIELVVNICDAVAAVLMAEVCAACATLSAYALRVVSDAASSVRSAWVGMGEARDTSVLVPCPCPALSLGR
jgi:hypothetical protein